MSPRGDRILSVLRIERIYGGDDLREIIFRLGFLGLVLHAAKSGEQKSHQNYDDRDDDEKFDKREAIFS